MIEHQDHSRRHHRQAGDRRLNQTVTGGDVTSGLAGRQMVLMRMKQDNPLMASSLSDTITDHHHHYPSSLNYHRNYSSTFNLDQHQQPNHLSSFHSLSNLSLTTPSMNNTSYASSYLNSKKLRDEYAQRQRATRSYEALEYRAGAGSMIKSDSGYGSYISKYESRGRLPTSGLKRPPYLTLARSVMGSSYGGATVSPLESVSCPRTRAILKGGATYNNNYSV